MANLFLARRRFFALLGFVLLLTVATACGSDGDESSSSSSNTQAAAEPTQIAPVVSDQGGEPAVQRLLFGTRTPSNESNDIRTVCCFDPYQHRPMYENIIGADPATSELIPGLATEWSVEPNGKSLRVKLRRGVEFHRGYGEMTADDVVFHYDNFIDFDGAHFLRSIYWIPTVEGVEKVGEYEVIYHLKRPDTFLFLALSDHQDQTFIYSKKYFEEVGAAQTLDDPPPPGTGPYEYVDRRQGGYMRYKAVDYDHWRSTPDFPEFEFRWIPENSTRLAALMAKEIHMADIPQDLQGEPKRSGFKVLNNSIPGNHAWMQYYCCWPDSEGTYPLYKDTQLSDLRVRKALNKAIDRQTMLEAFAPDGELTILNHFNSGPGYEGWDPSWETRFEQEYGYDPQAAKDLLADAGYGPNNPVSMTIPIVSCFTMPGCEDVAESVAGYWRDIGVNVKLLTMDPTAYRALARASRQGAVPLDEATVDYVRADASGIHQRYIIWNRQSWLGTSGASGFNTPETVELIKQMIGDMNWANHPPLLKQIGEDMFTGHYSMPLFNVPVQVVVDPEVVSGWVWPGVEFAIMTHIEDIKAVYK